MSDYFDRIERQIVRRVEAGVPRGSRFRLRLELLAPALGVVVVVAIAVVFLSVRGVKSPSSGAHGGVELVYRVAPTPQTRVVTRAALARAVAVMRRRAAAFGISGAAFRTTRSELTIQLPGVRNVARAEQEFGATRLEFYDWEANALTPNGHTVASQLEAHDAKALLISQGNGSRPPGSSNAGSMSLYDAVKLATMQPLRVSNDNDRLGGEYYLFGAPGSAACATAARDAGERPVPGLHCLLSGPADTIQDLDTAVPQGVSASQGQLLAIKPGTVVLQATPPSASSQLALGRQTARYYVLKDHVALFGDDITNPHQGTDQSGAPDVQFGFTSHGAIAFQHVTTAIAHRGDLVSGPGQTFNQHFAIALDSRLISVPSIDFRQYPDGIPTSHGADISSGLALYLATELRLGALPVQLQLIHAKPLAAGG